MTDKRDLTFITTKDIEFVIYFIERFIMAEKLDASNCQAEALDLADVMSSEHGAKIIACARTVVALADMLSAGLLKLVEPDDKVVPFKGLN